MELKHFTSAMAYYSSLYPKFSTIDFSVELTANAWHSELKDVDAHVLKKTMDHFIETSDKFPTVRLIKQHMAEGHSRTDEETGTEVANKIWEAIGKFGHWSPSEAEKYIGSVGWVVVRQCCGWIDVCDCTSADKPSLMKNWRELAAIIIKKARSGDLNSVPMLPEPENNPALTKALGIIAAGDQKTNNNTSIQPF